MRVNGAFTSNGQHGGFVRLGDASYSLRVLRSWFHLRQPCQRKVARETFLVELDREAPVVPATPAMHTRSLELFARDFSCSWAKGASTYTTERQRDERAVMYPRSPQQRRPRCPRRGEQGEWRISADSGSQDAVGRRTDITACERVRLGLVRRNNRC
uniref:Uncharacterized protein n=1 Tax=Mycena chlorophos TaxID=658473 RepID=A0ABQ0LZS4_MYCCL|nr:predicted protein [Mycena chlorophos]